MHSRASPILASARYRAVRKLGEGGMGAVFEVEDRELGGRCALKLMRASGDDGALLRFKREFRAVARIHHPNLVRLYELSSDDEHWFYTMELVDGVDLQTALTRMTRAHDVDARPTDQVTFESIEALATGDVPSTPRPEPRWAAATEPSPAESSTPLPATRCDLTRLGRLLPQLLDALACLHRHGLVHRDLKPENILVDRGDRLRILDFGIVQELAGLRVTGAGNLLGTLAYMSPEQCNEGEVTAASDLYSLGCVLFQLLTGQPPFGRGSLKVALDHQLAEPPLVSSRVSGVPDVYVALCRDLLAKDPLARPSITDVRRRLDLPDDLARHEPAPPTFVGRERERAFLTTRLEAARQGQVTLVFIEGPSGVGKSALARTVGETARAAGFSLFRGRCYERESVPFRAFDQVMDEVALHLRALPVERLRLLTPLIERVSWLFPALASFAHDEASRHRELPTPPRDPAARPAAKLHLAMASLEVLIAELAENTPLMIVVDDLQWTDDESVAILETLLRAEARLLLIALHRPVGVDERHPLARFFARHASHPALRRLTLGAMSVDELATMVHHHAAGAISAQAAATLAAEVAGNPFIAIQIGTLLRRPELGHRVNGPWHDLEIGELVRLRFEDLTPHARALVDLVACAGGALDRLVLADACDLSNAAFDTAATALSDERILTVVRTGVAALGHSEPFAYDFYHDCFRETAYAGLDAQRRRDLHKSLAEALERTGHAAPEALWHHWTAAGDRAWASRHALAAAEEAAAKLAFSRAAGLFADYLDARPASDDEGPEKRAAAFERLADLRELGGDLEGALVARADALTAWQACARDSEAAILAQHRLRRGRVRCLLHLKRYAAGRDELEALLGTRGLSMRRSRPGLLARLLSVQLRLWGWQLLPDAWGRRAPSASDREWLDLLELMMSIVITSWPLDGAEYALRYRLVARRLHGEGGLRAVCMQIIQHTLLYCPDARKQARLMRRVDHLEASHDAASLDAVSRCLLPYARGAIALHSDPAAAHAHLRTAIGILDAAGWIEAYEAATSRCIAVWAAEAAGLYHEGLALCRDLARFPTSLVALVTIPFEVRLHLARAETDQARARLDAWESVLPSDVSTTEHFWLRLLRAQVAVAAGDLDDGILAVLAQLRREARWTGDLFPSWPRSHFFAISLDARLALASRGRHSSRELRRTRKMAKALARRGWSNLRAAGLRALGVLALTRGDRSRARALIARALTQAKRSGGPWQTWLCLRLAHALGDPADKATLEAELATLEAAHAFSPSGLTAYEALTR